MQHKVSFPFLTPVSRDPSPEVIMVVSFLWILSECFMPVEASCVYLYILPAPFRHHLHKGLHTVHAILEDKGWDCFYEKCYKQLYYEKTCLLKISSILVNLYFFFWRFPFVAVSIGFVVNKKVCCLNLWLVKCLTLIFWERVNVSP